MPPKHAKTPAKAMISATEQMPTKPAKIKTAMDARNGSAFHATMIPNATRANEFQTKKANATAANVLPRIKTNARVTIVLPRIKTNAKTPAKALISVMEQTPTKPAGIITVMDAMNGS